MNFKSLNFTLQWTYLTVTSTSLARDSGSTVSKNRRGHFINVSRRLPARGGSACIATTSLATLL